MPAVHAQQTNPAAGNGVGSKSSSTQPSANRQAPSLTSYQGPLSALGYKLNDAGFFPYLFVGEWYVANPNSGVHPGSHQWMTQVNAGFDYYLEPLLGLKGTSIHFMEGWVPWITHQTDFNNYYTQAGDIINGSASGFVPVPAHLTRFTLEQELMDKKLFLEGGKGYVQDYVARPDCLNAFMCMSTIAITHKAAGFNFPNYSNWLGRVGYNITPNLKVQGIWYTYDNDAALTNGWDWSRPSYYSAYLVDVQYGNTQQAYPSAYELAYYHDKVPQTDALCLFCTKTVTNWQDGIFASAKKAFWRPDINGPTMLQGFASLGTAFNARQTESPSVGGINYAFDTGLILRAPFQSRPYDSYSLQLTVVQLTKDEQTYLTNQGFGSPGRVEYSIGPSAMFRLHQYVYVSAYAEYLIHMNAAFASNEFVNPNHDMPRDGFGVGLTFFVQLSQLLGLDPEQSGYDGHYP